MAWSTAAINAAAEAVGDLLDIGTGTPSVEFGNADFSQIYLTQPLDGTNAFNAATAGVSLANIPAGGIAATTTGTATHSRLKNRNGAVIDAPSAAADAIAGLITTGATPTLELGNSDFSVIYATLSLTTFAAASGGVANANGLPISFTGLADGAPTHQRWKDGAGVVVGDETIVGSASITTGSQYSAPAVSISAASLQQTLTTSVAIATGTSYSTSNLSLTQPAA